MIRINQLKMPIGHKKEELADKIAKTLKAEPGSIKSFNIVKQSIDARKKDNILYIYTIDVDISKEEAVLHRVKNMNIASFNEKSYAFPAPGTTKLMHRPVIAGTGPAGLFAGLMLARGGYCPVLLERGSDVEERTKAVDAFWSGMDLDLKSNVQFGEGGAGTFSDGKLNTLVKDPVKRNYKVMETLVEFGADPEILYQNKPHIGTDVLSRIVKQIREEIIRLGGTVRFLSQITDLAIENNRLCGVMVDNTELLRTEVLILAIGHSARDTFEVLYSRGIPMASKAFAAGIRIQHPQSMINISQYGKDGADKLGPASYKLTHRSKSGRGVYSFCMCPGGYVVDASSEKGGLAVNGMSNHDRDGKNANSAIIVSVTPEDFPDQTPLAGVDFQRNLEKLAYEHGAGRIPLQLFGDFKKGIRSADFGTVQPQMKGRYAFANLQEMLPPYLSDSIIEGIDTFGDMIKGFNRYDAILAGVESRTSSPVRIERDQDFESQIKGLFPCGEGAGYAGGITSAAMDGIKSAEEIGRRFAPFTMARA